MNYPSFIQRLVCIISIKTVKLKGHYKSQYVFIEISRFHFSFFHLVEGQPGLVQIIHQGYKRGSKKSVKHCRKLWSHFKILFWFLFYSLYWNTKFAVFVCIGVFCLKIMSKTICIML